MKIKPMYIILALAAIALIVWIWYDKYVFDTVMEKATYDPEGIASRQRSRYLPRDFDTPSGDEIITWEGNRDTILSSDLRRRV